MIVCICFVYVFSFVLICMREEYLIITICMSILTHIVCFDICICMMDYTLCGQ